MRVFSFLILGILCGASCAFAAEAPPDQFADVPPPPPPTAGPAALPEPEITIVQREKETVREYRINNRLYMVKIEPAVGPAYFLVDQDGDGKLEARFGDVYNARIVPQWVLFSWN
ncbi:MAG: DUF2782 domain-containing protein [Gammaproteobacteria bacterium]|nr:DUF2782 domain-containing protein [Gammaproteobacteria bacterium]